MDSCDDGEAFPEMGDGAHHSAFAFYAAVTGLHVSSIRAAVMSSILLGSFFFERKVFALNSLAAAAFFLLCWDTNEFFSTGFQLSFAVVDGIILLADPLSGWLRLIGAPDPFLPRRLVSGLRRMIGVGYEWICRGGSVSLAAWLGSLPLIFWYFHLITPSSLFANLVVVPIAFFILAIALLSLVVVPIASGLSLIFNNANWTLATAVIAFIQWFAQVPGSHYYVAEPSWPKNYPRRSQCWMSARVPPSTFGLRELIGFWIAAAAAITNESFGHICTGRESIESPDCC